MAINSFYLFQKIYAISFILNVFDVNIKKDRKKSIRFIAILPDLKFYFMKENFKIFEKYLLCQEKFKDVS